MIFVEIFHDSGWLFATRIRIRFIEADPADQNETDPNGSGSATLRQTMICSTTRTVLFGTETTLHKNINFITVENKMDNLTNQIHYW